MKERPILFSAPMVLALLGGTKTQTRRVLKTQPSADVARIDRTATRTSDRADCFTLRNGNGKAVYGLPEGKHSVTADVVCPYGGRPWQEHRSRLWVRETWRVDGWDDGTPYATIRYRADDAQLVHRIGADLDVFAETTDERWRKAGADDDDDGNLCFPDGRHEPWRPSIFTPRWASRITLEITDVRVERLQAITQDDAIAEGITLTTAPPIPTYAHLWGSINGAGAWGLNPWVWVISFARVTP